MTGCVFSQACVHVGIDFNSQAPLVNLVQNEKLGKYINHLYLSWVNGDIIDLKTGNIAAETLGSISIKRRYPEFIYSNMILLWGLTSKLRARDIRECLYKVFGAGSVAVFCHLDETAALVQFSKEELVSEFLELKDTLERENNNPISVLHPLSKILETGSVRAANYEIYKQICSSTLSEVLFADQAEAVGINRKIRMLTPAQDQKRAAFTTNVANVKSNNNFPDEEISDSLYPSEAQLSR